MTPERWRKIELIYSSARERKPDQREHFLDGACGDDSELRREIEALLQRSDPQSLSADLAVTQTIAHIDVGSQLGPYKIEAPLGAGGMGEVFRGLDTRLNRAVAIKISKEQFSARFEREARAIAQLNHPHICTLYDVGPNYLVMELVEGDTLSARLKKGALQIDQVLRYGAQIADALATAHAKGVIHRDLKPANVMIAKTGVKVLDFGLAKTLTDENLTQSNVVLGTPAYMAPEQREGKEADARADIYALGLVLREMATGKKSQEMNGLLPQFAHVVQRCLEPDPADRWQAASDIRKELEWIATSRPAAAVPAARSSSWRLAWIIAAVACVGLIAAGVALFRRELLLPPDLGRSEFAVSFEKQMGGLYEMPVPSPDGRSFVFPGKDADGVTVLWVRSLESVEARKLQGTEGADGAIIWSPDSAWIGFYAGGKLKKINASGGPPQTIAELSGFQDADWGPQGDIIYRPTNRVALFRIPDSGGAPQPLTTLNKSLTENSHRFPQFLPDGRRFLFVSRCGERANNALYIGSLDSKEVKRLMPAQSRVRYVPPRNGRPAVLVYYRDGALVAQPVDLGSGKPTANPVTVLNQVGYVPASIRAAFNVSSDGRVIIAGSDDASDDQLIWFSRSGENLGVVGARGESLQPRISPAGDRVAYTRPDPQTGNRDIWYTEFARGITARLTTHVANDWYPVWSPDSRQILFGSDRDGGTALVPYLKTSMDPGSSESRVGALNDTTPYDWSRDGRWISYGAADLRVAPASGDSPPFVFLATPALENDGRFSPDTKWLAYISNESGRSEVYVRPFAGKPATPIGKVQVSTAGGEYPVWGPSGQELFYMAGDASIFAVDTRNLGRTDALPVPTRLFKACPETQPEGAPLTGAYYEYAFDTHDGQRFLVVCHTEPPGRFTVLMNWNFAK